MCSCGIYTADPITARVVDADTKTPLEGVHVVAAWEVKGGLEGGNIEGYIKVMETTTGSNGEFRFPSWGPRLNPHFGGIQGEAPLLMFLKRGYVFKAEANMISGKDSAPSHMTSQWNGKIIPLQRESSSLDDRSRTLDLLTMYTNNLRAYGGHWHAIPSFLCEMGLVVTLFDPHHYDSLDDLKGYGISCPGVDRSNVK